MSDPKVLTKDTVLTIREQYTHNIGSETASGAYIRSLCDSHEALRAEVERLTQEHAEAFRQYMVELGLADARAEQAEAALAAMTAERDSTARAVTQASREIRRLEKELTHVDEVLDRRPDESRQSAILGIAAQRTQLHDECAALHAQIVATAWVRAEDKETR